MVKVFDDIQVISAQLDLLLKMFLLKRSQLTSPILHLRIQSNQN